MTLVAVLAAFPLPALKSAREKANVAACASNLRQIHQAVVLFAMDHEGWLPRASIVRETPDTTLRPTRTSVSG